jgi:hypothetical protein
MGSMHNAKIYSMLILMLLTTAACDGAGEAETEGAGAAAEQASGQEQMPMGAETMQQVMEVQQIQQRLEPISRQALQDEELANQLQELQARVQAAMREENPELVDRMEKLQEEMIAAQQAGDQAALQNLRAGAAGLQQEAQQLQAAVLERPQVREAIQEFEAAHRARMIEIDPEAEALIERLDEIVASQPGGPAPAGAGVN